MSKVAITGNASGTGVFTVASPNSNVDRVLTLPDETGTVLTTATTLTPSATNTSITLGTAVATTSGTSIDFTGIPAGVKRVTVSLNKVSTNGTANLLVQIGAGGVVETSGYEGHADAGASTGAITTVGVPLTFSNAAGNLRVGGATLVHLGNNLWVSTSVIIDAPASPVVSIGASVKTLAGVLDRVRLTTVNGTDAFDAGSVNISWEF